MILIVIAANTAPKLTIVEVNCGKHSITTHGIVTNTAALNGTPALLFFANPSGISPLSAAAWIALDVRVIIYRDVYKRQSLLLIVTFLMILTAYKVSTLLPHC